MNIFFKRLLSVLLAVILSITTFVQAPAIASASNLPAKILYWGLVDCYGRNRGQSAPVGEAKAWLTVFPTNPLGTISGLKWRFSWRDSAGFTIQAEQRAGFAGGRHHPFAMEKLATYDTLAPITKPTPDTVRALYLLITGWPDGPGRGAFVLNGEAETVTDNKPINIENTTEYACDYLDEEPEQFPIPEPIPVAPAEPYQYLESVFMEYQGSNGCQIFPAAFGGQPQQVDTGSVEPYTQTNVFPSGSGFYTQWSGGFRYELNNEPRTRALVELDSRFDTDSGPIFHCGPVFRFQD